MLKLEVDSIKGQFLVGDNAKATINQCLLSADSNEEQSIWSLCMKSKFDFDFTKNYNESDTITIPQLTLISSHNLSLFVQSLVIIQFVDQCVCVLK